MITAIVSKKGGVGKTTTAVGIAAALAGIGKRVLLVDLDSQASASLSLGVERSRLGPSIADVLLRDATIEGVVRPTRVERLDLITASTDLTSLDAEFGLTRDRHQRLARALEPLTDDYPFIIIDCPPSLPLAATMALYAADNFISPVMPEFLASVGVQNLLRAVERLDELGRRTRCLGLVLNRVDYRTKTHRQNVQQIRETFGSLVFAVEVRTNISLAGAPERGETIFEFDRNSTGARAMRLLAAEALIRLHHKPTRPVHDLMSPNTGPVLGDLSGNGLPGSGIPGHDIPRHGISGQGISGQGISGQGFPEHVGRSDASESDGTLAFPMPGLREFA